ncbi:hypothetical protein KC352_g38241, partial [Hortaea werneckii]
MTDTTTTHRDHHSGLTGFPVVWSRDFAYADRGPVALLPFMPEERADINAISARHFAEYVRFSVSRNAVVHGTLSGHESVASLVDKRARLL